MQALVDAQNVERRIEEVGAIYRSLTGTDIRPRSGQDAEIPPEKDPLVFVNERLQQLLSLVATATSAAPGPAWTPAADVCLTEQEIAVLVDVPGVARADLSVSVTEHVLVVAGERRALRAEGRLERPTGRFQRFVPLPLEASTERVEATVADGVLTVRFARGVRSTNVKNVEVR